MFVLPVLAVALSAVRVLAGEHTAPQVAVGCAFGMGFAMIWHAYATLHGIPRLARVLAGVSTTALAVAVAVVVVVGVAATALVPWQRALPRQQPSYRYPKSTKAQATNNPNKEKKEKKKTKPE